MAAVDFITVLGRVLHDGAMRDAFAADANAFLQQSGLRSEDHPAFLRLVPGELEQQARVLLRKRFDLVQQMLPQTCRALGNQAWPYFERYGRTNAPKGEHQPAKDADAFFRALKKIQANAGWTHEQNRARFIAADRRISCHFVTLQLPHRGRRTAMQVLWRGAARRREWFVHF